MVNGVKFISVIGGPSPFHHLAEPVKDEPVQFRHPFDRPHVLCDVKIGKIAQDEPAGIADPAIGVGQLPHDIIGNADISPVIGRSGPEPEHIGPVLFDNRIRRHHIANGLGHFAPVLIHHKAMGENGLIGGLAGPAHTGQKGGMKPSPVLVASLQIHIGRARQPFPFFEDGRMAHPGIKPDIQDIMVLCKFGRTAFAACCTLGHQILCLFFKPDIRGMFTEQGVDLIHRFPCDIDFRAGFTIKDRDGNPPGPLP